jgi:hypothetical protein
VCERRRRKPLERASPSEEQAARLHERRCARVAREITVGVVPVRDLEFLVATFFAINLAEHRVAPPASRSHLSTNPAEPADGYPRARSSGVGVPTGVTRCCWILRSSI